MLIPRSCSYNGPEKPPVCDYYHHRSYLALLGVPVVPWGCPKSIVNISINSNYEDCLHMIYQYLLDSWFKGGTMNLLQNRKSITLENLLMMASGLKCDIAGIGLNMFSTFPWLSLQVKSLNIATESHISYLSLSKNQQK